MRTLTAAALAAFVSTSAMAAEPITLDDDQLDSVAAGLSISISGGLSASLGDPPQLASFTWDGTNLVCSGNACGGFVITVN